MTANSIQILFESPDWLAVNKPPGISIHNVEDPGNLITVLAKSIKGPLFPVHRLDKETSGVQVFALHEKSAQQLASAFQSREVTKTYQGILRGALKNPEGVWTKSLTDKSEGRKNPQGLAKDRVPCETGYKVLQATRFFSFCEFNLITGRQHQIRKHAALEQHHLVGDNRYGDQKYNQKMAEMYKIDRMFLHCFQLTILGKILEAPTPPEFSSLFKS